MAWRARGSSGEVMGPPIVLFLKRSTLQLRELTLNATLGLPAWAALPTSSSLPCSALCCFGPDRLARLRPQAVTGQRAASSSHRPRRFVIPVTCCTAQTSGRKSRGRPPSSSLRYLNALDCPHNLDSSHASSFPFATVVLTMIPSPPGQLSRTESLSLLSLSVVCISVLANTFQGDGEPLIASIAFSGIAYALTYALIRWLGTTFMKAGLKGRDLCKTRTDEMLVLLYPSACVAARRNQRLTLWIVVPRRWALYAQLFIFSSSLSSFRSLFTKI